MAAEIARALSAGKNRQRDRERGLSLEEVEKRMTSAGKNELRRLLRFLQESQEPAAVPLIFLQLSHPSQAVRNQARKAVHGFGWEKVSAAAEGMARRNDPGISAVLDGLAAFESHPQVVTLLDSLAALVKGDLRNRAILLLERKRLGLELDAVASLFRKIHSPYRIEKALGQGLFAASYLAQTDGANLAVVVRVLRPEFVCQPQLRAQFLDLNQRALQLVHENLVLTREARAFPERNMYFAVRDYVHGVTLQKLLGGGKIFERPQVLQILRQLLAALAAVHRRGMIHGGLKPSNVFICDEHRVILGDPAVPPQGLGVALERLSYDYRYAAPETFRGGAMQPQADFYSLGCLGYELACGRPPFVADNYLELAGHHLHESPVPPSQCGSRLGSEGDGLLLKLLARSQSDRYASAEDILLALDELDDSPGPQRLRAPWGSGRPGAGERAVSLLHDASMARLTGAESILGFDASAASQLSQISKIEAPVQQSPLDRPPEHTPPPSAAVSPGNPPAQPTQMGDYEILEKLGSGGMGLIYKARDRRLDRVVALKMLRPRVADQGPQGQDRFQTEAKAVARLQHPHILQIYDIGEHQGIPYLALEYVSGGSLAERQRREPLSPRLAAEMVLKLARAVHHAHEHGVLHRDLKPSNILLTPDGEPRIADFGLAKMKMPDEEELMGTIAGTIVGTPTYMSPEQAAGKVKELGPEADVYSLGTILYELLTGRPPFRGATVFETLSQLATEIAVPPHEINSHIAADLSAICLKCLAKNPQERYGSAQTLAADLQVWLGGRSLEARRPSRLERLWHWSRQALSKLVK